MKIDFEKMIEEMKQAVDKKLNSLSDEQKEQLIQEIDDHNDEYFENELNEITFKNNSAIFLKSQLKSDPRICIVTACSGFENKTEVIVLPVCFDKQDNDRMDVIKVSQLQKNVKAEILQKTIIFDSIAKELVASQ